MQRHLTAALAVLVAASSTVVLPATASAGPGDGTLTVKVVRDVNGNGTYEAALELGVEGSTVVVTDPAGATATGTTDAGGAITIGLGPVNGGKYRVQVSPPQGSVLQPAPAGSGLQSNTMFVDVAAGKNVSVTTGLWNPADYCQSSPALATACQRDVATFGVEPTAKSLITFPWTARAEASNTSISTQGDTGTVFGMAYQRVQKRIFSAAFAKRLAAYGPGKQGAIYVTPATGGATTLFTTVPDAGTTEHQMDSNADGPFFPVVGKESLGDIDLSEDGTELYVVNLKNRRLYVYDTTAATASAPKADYAIPNPACKADVDWRPAGLGVRDGVVYVGGVCSAQSTGAAADMLAKVITFENGVFGPAIVSKGLDFPRGALEAFDKWHPWQDAWDFTLYPDPVDKVAYKGWPMAMLTDIDVENNGDLVLNFRDRFGDQGGYRTPAPDGSGILVNTLSGGDLNRACRNASGGYDWEGTGACPNNRPSDPKGGKEDASVIEYYPGEYWDDPNPEIRHYETALGATALVPRQQQMPAILMDPTALFSNGVGWFDRTTGQSQAEGSPNGYLIVKSTEAGFGKANGLADLEALCDLAPVQLGNRVWFDTDADGVQDGDEPAVAGVKVTATPCGGGAALPVKTTNTSGEYYFGEADGLKPETCYDLAFDYSDVDTSALPGAPPLDTLKWTVGKTGSDRAADSDVDTAGKTSVTMGKPGDSNHTVDAGITAAPTNKVGDYVWLDSNRNGVQDDGEPGVEGATVVLKKADGTQVGSPKTSDAQGKYLFDGLEDGTYSVCFTLPAGSEFTTRDAGTDDAKDSDADPATGCVKPVTLNIDKRVDPTLDLGIAPPVNRIGDLVWKDLNGNGVQDSGEPGVPDVKVTLKETGATTTTDKDGKYLFEDMPDGSYTVCFDVKNLPDAVKDYTLTKADAGDDAKDSDPATDCTPAVPVGVGKRENLTVDAGLVAPPNKIGDLVWEDANRNGVQDPGEVVVPGVTVKLVDDKGNPVGEPVKTNENGRYLFTDVPDGTYKVYFDVNALPGKHAGYLPVNPGQGTDRAKDSDADVATGRSGPVTVGVGKRENLDVDLGIVKPTNRLGDFVWFDDNADGLQDPNEKGVPDLPVFLQDGSGKPVAQTKTDKNGKYMFDGLEDGEYKVCFNADPVTRLVAGRPLTKQGAGDNGIDSDADPASGCTRVVKLGADKKVDLSLDAGLAPKGASPAPSQSLASTGVQLWGALTGGLALLLAGAYLMLMARRREQ